tara:strand:+ start:2705 stop:3040 length:336 start_codon:yes stop_codon:yes gene_type:complete
MMTTTLLYVSNAILVVWVLTLKVKGYWKDHLAITLNLKQEIIICLVCVGIAFTAIALQKVKKNASHAFDIGSLDTIAQQHINPLDQSFAGSWAIEAKDKGKFVKNMASGKN